MTAIELKRKIMKTISEIDDEVFLNAIKTILDTKSSTKVLKLSHEQLAEIIASKKEINQGLFLEQDEIENKYCEWLKVN
jgi:predicted transcriptional regulator